MIKSKNMGESLFSIGIVLFFLDVIPHNIEHVRIKDNDIKKMHLSYIKPYMNKEYANRYVPLPMHKNNLPWHWEGKDFPRVIALLEFERFVHEHSISCKKGLAINEYDPEWYCLHADQVIQIDYEKAPDTYDLHILDLEDKDFDFVMVNQTLEHLYDPLYCLQNIYRHMRFGGILYFNVPALNIPHATPFHYYMGFTPIGIGIMAQLAGFKILSIGQWGNREYLKKMFETYDWPDYRQFKDPGYNDFAYPVITWIFCQKV